MKRQLIVWCVGAAACVATIAAQPSQAEPSRIRVVPGLEEPLVVDGEATPAERAALESAIASFERIGGAASDFAQTARPFEAYLAAHPHSPSRASLLLDLGLGYYHNGFFSRAAAAWQASWQAGRLAEDISGKALADRAFGELARMHARVGDRQALQALLESVGDRPIGGSASEMVVGAREGLWTFDHDSGIAYLCGPKALGNLLTALQAAPETLAVLDKVRSGPHGFTFAQVSTLADDVKLEHRIVRRNVGDPVPVPAIVHWKMNHYAAIVGQSGESYRVKDPTFGGGDMWVSRAAIDAESSGLFLVPAAAQSSLPWRTAAASDAEAAFGMGFTGNNQPGGTTPCDNTTTPTPTPGTPSPMCASTETSMVVSLKLTDVPIGYEPQLGPSARIQLTYNQREAYQPAVPSYFNISPKWTLNVLSFIQDSPSSPGNSVLRYVAGGGAIDYTLGYSYNGSTGVFSPERQSQARLVRIPATGAVSAYELRMPDGSKQVFARPDGATVYPRRVFLTQMVDAHGNTATLNYDSQLRLTSLTDATGRLTKFFYGATNPLLITRIVDPFGRFATLGYDSSGRLASITDPIGITSAFGYDSAGLVNSLTTPYGVTRYTYGQDTNQNSRFLTTTDPLGATERVEFRHVAPGMPYGDPVAPAGFNNDYLYYRNTFYWDKYVFGRTGADYTKARVTHWLHNPAGQTSPVIESVKGPLENRIWFKYPDQSTTYFEGSAETPLSAARVLDDGSTQTRNVTYNSIGKPLTMIDPLGRRTVFTYSADGIDLLQVDQQVGTAATALATMSRFTYNAQHRPVTSYDAAGNLTTTTYNAAGQIASVTNALHETTTYLHDGLGRLTTIVNANGVAQQTLTYDEADRVATSTDSEGRVQSYSYDAIDRVTAVRYADGTSTEYQYDKLDTVAVKDRLGRVTRNAYDANRRLVSVTDNAGHVTRYDYFPNGIMAGMTDPRGNRTSWDIDIQSRPIAKHFPDGRTESYTYEAATGRQKSTTDALGQVRTKTYFADDLLKSVAYTRSVNATASVSFTYDRSFPRPVSMVDGLGSTTWTYFPPGQPGAINLAAEDGPYGNDTVRYTYDALGRVSTRTVDASTESFSYDALGRIVAHGSALGAFNRAYLGQTPQVVSQVATSGTVGTSWSYESNADDRRLKSVGSSGAARTFGLTTLPVGTISSIQESLGGAAQRTWSYAYDDDDRLIHASATDSNRVYGYSYDAADNLFISGTSSTYNALNQLTQFAGAPIVYDANGNMLGDGQRSYAWDAENRLIGIAMPPSRSTKFRYDGLGRRLGIVDTLGASVSETRHLWCGDVLCQARGPDDVVNRRYVLEGQVIPQGNTLLYYGVDQLGSVRDVLAMQNGSRVASYDYDPFGSVTNTSGRITTDMRFAKLFHHGASGLELAAHRVYDARLGTWISRDPIEESGGTNLYAYAGSDPLSRIDPSGLVPNVAELTCLDPLQPVCWAGVGVDIATDVWAAYRVYMAMASAVQVAQEAQREAEYQAYKNRCNESPPPGLDPCATRRWQRDRNIACRDMRQLWDDKWEPGRHANDIANLDRGIARDTKWIDENCPKQCPEP